MLECVRRRLDNLPSTTNREEDDISVEVGHTLILNMLHPDPELRLKAKEIWNKADRILQASRAYGLMQATQDSNEETFGNRSRGLERSSIRSVRKDVQQYGYHERRRTQSATPRSDQQHDPCATFGYPVSTSIRSLSLSREAQPSLYTRCDPQSSRTTATRSRTREPSAEELHYGCVDSREDTRRHPKPTASAIDLSGVSHTFRGLSSTKQSIRGESVGTGDILCIEFTIYSPEVQYGRVVSSNVRNFTLPHRLTPRATQPQSGTASERIATVDAKHPTFLADQSRYHNLVYPVYAKDVPRELKNWNYV